MKSRLIKTISKLERITVISLISAMILFGACVSISHAIHDLFKDIDKNIDGRISEDEFERNMKENTFGRLDPDSDRYISFDEWRGLNDVRDEKKHIELFEKIDTDKDRRINFFEFSDYAEMHSNIHEAFIGLDKDGSNYLSPDEITLRPLFKMITIRFR